MRLIPGRAYIYWIHNIRVYIFQMVGVLRQALRCSCHLRLHACDRSLFARGLSIDSRAYVISQHVRWPIRAPLPTCANQDAWVVITPKRPKANSIHTAAYSRLNTNAIPKYRSEGCIFLNTFSRLIYPSLTIVPFWFGGSRHGWGLFLEQTEFLQRDTLSENQ